MNLIHFHKSRVCYPNRHMYDSKKERHMVSRESQQVGASPTPTAAVSSAAGAYPNNLSKTRLKALVSGFSTNVRWYSSISARSVTRSASCAAIHFVLLRSFQNMKRTGNANTLSHRSALRHIDGGDSHEGEYLHQVREQERRYIPHSLQKHSIT